MSDQTTDDEQTYRHSGLRLSSRRVSHLKYAPDFPDPLPRNFGHQPAVIQERIPFHLLVADHDPARTPDSTLISAEELRQNKKDLNWAFKREQAIAAAAAGVHMANYFTHWMNDQFRYLDHMYAPKHEALYSQFGKW